MSPGKVSHLIFSAPLIPGDMSPGIGISATSRPGNPGFVPGYRGKCCSVNRDSPQMNQETASEGTKGQSITAIEAVPISFFNPKRVYDTILGRASMKILKEPSRSYYKKGRWRSIKNQKDNPELVKPALSVAPPKPTSNSDEDADADQVKLEDVALESGDISTLNSLVGNGKRMKLAISITKPFKVYIRSGETLLYENICFKVGINMQGIAMEVDLYVLMMKGMLRRQQQQQIATNAKIQRRLWDPGIKIFFRHHIENKAALQAELQATKGLIQVESYGCGGVTASPIPCSMRFDVPKFSGTDPDRWIFSITRMDSWRVYDTVLGRASMKILREPSRSYYKKGRWGNIKNWLNRRYRPHHPNQFPTQMRMRTRIKLSYKSGDISTLNSLVGNGSPQTLQLCGTIGLGNTHVLIDNESTHNFVQPGVVEWMKLAISITKPFKVYIGSGETLLYENICSKVGINMQGIELDKNKLLLKDQVTARKQQFGAFQEDMTGLQAELQATKGLIQAGSYGCGGETASPILCSMRFDVPKFSGTDPDRWIFSVTGMDSWRVYDTVLGRAKACLGDQQVSLVSNTTIVNSGGEQNQKDNPELVKPALSAAPPKPISNSDEDADADQLKLEDVALESGDISTLNSLVGNGSPRTLQLCGTIGLGNTHVLIDNDSTHNFVQPGVVERMKLAVSITKPFKVYIGSGETLLYENICSKVGINMQRIAMEVDFSSKRRRGTDYEPLEIFEIDFTLLELFNSDDMEELNKGRERTLDPQEVLTNMKGWKIKIKKGVKNNGRGRVDKIYRPRDSNKMLRFLSKARKFIEENSYQRRASDNGEGKGSSQDPNVNFSLSSAELFQHPDVNLSSLGGN
nr:major facilitator, sugar transporter-like, major facilitator superfamily domain protein [Tanacetum cinerariifolium]